MFPSVNSACTVHHRQLGLVPAAPSSFSQRLRQPRADSLTVPGWRLVAQRRSGREKEKADRGQRSAT